jgi:wyosine [tRNA(Phe)-imidazoG37] synthetase (radical SAM superfamily)
LEIFILPGYNDSKNEILKLKEVIQDIKPDKIQVNTLDRPGAVENIRAANKTELDEIVKAINLENVEIIAAAVKRKEVFSYRIDAENAIIETISRRPCTLDDLVKILGLHLNEVNKYLDVLESEGKIEFIRQKRGLFYRSKNN